MFSSPYLKLYLHYKSGGGGLGTQLPHLLNHNTSAEPPSSTDWPIFLWILDYKYGRNIENTKSFGQLGKHNIICGAYCYIRKLHTKILKMVCYTEIQTARLEALPLCHIATWLSILQRNCTFSA